MRKLIERLLDFYFFSLLSEGERYVKIRTLSVQLKALRDLRKIAIFQVVLVFLVVLFTVSIFFTASHLLTQYLENKILFFDGLLLFSLTVAVVAAVCFYFLMREEFWMSWLGYSDKLRQLTQATAAPVRARTYLAMEGSKSLSDGDIQAITSIVEQLVDQRVKETLRSVGQAKTEPASDSMARANPLQGSSAKVSISHR